MSRSNWKINYLPRSILKMRKNLNKGHVWAKASIIPEFLIDKTIKIYNGKEFKALKITKEKIGYKFGEFIPTRKVYSYKGKKKAIKKK